MFCVFFYISMRLDKDARCSCNQNPNHTKKPAQKKPTKPPQPAEPHVSTLLYTDCI